MSSWRASLASWLPRWNRRDNSSVSDDSTVQFKVVDSFRSVASAPANLMTNECPGNEIIPPRFSQSEPLLINRPKEKLDKTLPYDFHKVEPAPGDRHVRSSTPTVPVQMMDQFNDNPDHHIRRPVFQYPCDMYSSGDALGPHRNHQGGDGNIDNFQNVDARHVENHLFKRPDFYDENFERFQNPQNYEFTPRVPLNPRNYPQDYEFRQRIPQNPTQYPRHDYATQMPNMGILPEYDCAPGMFRKSIRQRDPKQFDGNKIEWCDYLKHFEVVALWNKWNDSQKAQQLVMSFDGDALKLLGELSAETLNSYALLVQELNRRYDPAERAEAWKIEFRNRSRKTNESITQYAQALNRLVQKAFPQMPTTAQEQWVVDQFTFGLGSYELKKHVQFGHPKSLNEAISLAIEFEAFESGMKDKFKKPIPKGEVSVLAQQTPSASETQSKNKNDKSEIVCFYCKKVGHMKKDCYKWKKKLLSLGTSFKKSTDVKSSEN